MRQLWFRRALDFRDDALSENFSEFDAPLVEGINAPDGSRCEDGVFVERDQFPECRRREFFEKDCVRRAISLKDAVRDKPFRRAFRFYLFGGFAKGQSFGLRTDVCQKHIVMTPERIE